MRLIVHHLRKDVRQHRGLLIVWFVVLALDLGLNLGMLGGEATGPGESGPGMSMVFSMWTMLFLYAMLVTIPVQVMLADSPGRLDRFTATRPVSSRQLLGAKALFVVLFVVVPPALQEGVYLGASGVAAKYILAACVERIVLIVPIAVLSAGFAALWSHEKACYPAAVGVLLWCVACSGVFEIGARGAGWRLARQSVSDFGMLISGLCMGAMLSIVVATLNTRFRWRTARRCIVIGLVCAAASFVHLLLPWEPFRTSTATADLAPAFAGAAVRVSRGNVHSNLHQESRGGQSVMRVGLNIVPVLDGAPDGLVVQWRGDTVTYTGESGSAKGVAAYFGQRPYGWRSRCHEEEVRAFVPLFPESTLFLTDHLMRGTACHLGAVPFADWQRLAGGMVRVEADLAGMVHRWSVAAELPLRAGAQGQDDASSWRIVDAWRTDDGRGVRVWLDCTQVSLWAMGDVCTPRVSHWPGSQYEFVLYSPAERLAWLPQNSPHARYTWGIHTARFRGQTEVEFSGRHGVPGAIGGDGDEWRLYILRREFVGTVTHTWHADAVSLPRVDEQMLHGHVSSSQMLSHSELRLRLAGLERPAAPAPAAEWARYVSDLVSLMELAPSGDDSLERSVHELLPDRLPELIEALDVAGGRGQWTIMHAIENGAPESGKRLIIDALAEHPGLVTTIVVRGWIDDARPELYRLLDASRELQPDMMRAFAWFEDPMTYPRLLDQLEASPRVEFYEMLRLLPGMEGDLADTVNRMWDTRVPLLGDTEPPRQLSVVLRHGRDDALREALRMLRLCTRTRGYYVDRLAGMLAENIVLTGLPKHERQNETKVLAWLAPHSAEDFEFDSVRRRFVLTKGR